MRGLTVGATGLAVGVALLGGGPPQSSATAVPASFLPFFLRAAHRFAVPARLLEAVAEVESGFDPAAVGPPVPGGPALGMMQFLPSSWRVFNVVPGATPFQPGPAVLAAASYLHQAGRRADGWWDAAVAVFGYNHSWSYVAHVLQVARSYGYAYPGPVRS